MAYLHTQLIYRSKTIPSLPVLANTLRMNGCEVASHNVCKSIYIKRATIQAYTHTLHGVWCATVQIQSKFRGGPVHYTDYLSLHSVRSCLLSLNISTNSEFVATHSHHFVDYSLWLIRPPTILFYINIIIVQYTVYTLWLFESCPTASWNCSLSFLLQLGFTLFLHSTWLHSVPSAWSPTVPSAWFQTADFDGHLGPATWLPTADAASTTGFLGIPEWDSDTFNTS